MINERATLENLHTEFPEFTLEDLFDILDCIVEKDDQVTIHTPHIYSPSTVIEPNINKPGELTWIYSPSSTKPWCESHS